MQVRIEGNYLSQFYPTEDRFRNYEINYEFEQPKDYVNRVVFLDGKRHIVLIAQKITVEYTTAKSIFGGYPTIRIIKKRKTRKPAMIHG